MSKSTGTSLILLGILAIIAGIIAIAWPSITIVAFVILFSVYAFSDALLKVVEAVNSDSAGQVTGRLVLALVDIAAGALALAWPSATALVLVLITAVWAFIGGFVEIIAAFGSDETAGSRAMFVIGGLMSVVFGVILFSRPSLGATTLALLFGLFAVMYGVSQIIIGTNLRGAGKLFGAVS